MTVRPLDDNVFVKAFEAEILTAGGIALPKSGQQSPNKGRVTAVGPGKRNSSGERNRMSVTINDIVVYGQYAGSEVKVDGESYQIMKESDILAIVSDQGGVT